MIKKLLLVAIVVTGLLLAYFFWPKNDFLPNLGEVKGAELHTVNGETYDFSSQKVKLVSFFYTKCPDICPATMLDLNQLKQKLQEQGLFQDQVEIISITLDPEDDTDEQLQKYAASFDIQNKGWFLLKGDNQKTELITNQFNMNYRKEKNGFITHSTTMYLVDQSNTIRSYHDMAIANERVDIEEIMKNIQLLVKN